VTTARKPDTTMLFGVQVPKYLPIAAVTAVIAVTFSLGSQWAIYGDRAETLESLKPLPGQVNSLTDRVSALETKTAGIPDLTAQVAQVAATVDGLAAKLDSIPALERTVNEMVTTANLIRPMRDRFQMDTTAALQALQNAMAALAVDMASVRTALDLRPTRARATGEGEVQ
jgi:hypothetical protein